MNGRRVDLRSAEPKVSDKVGSSNKYEQKDGDKGDRNRNNSYSRSGNHRDSKDNSRNNFNNNYRNDRDRRGGQGRSQNNERSDDQPPMINSGIIGESNTDSNAGPFTQFVGDHFGASARNGLLSSSAQNNG